MTKQVYKCLNCGRDNFDRPNQPHWCKGNFRKHKQACIPVEPEQSLRQPSPFKDVPTIATNTTAQPASRKVEHCTLREQMPLISDAVQEKLYCKWIDQDDDKYHNAIAKAQRDADMSCIPAIKAQAVKEFAEKCIKTIQQAPELSRHGFDIPASKIKADVVAHIRAMAKGVDHER